MAGNRETNSHSIGANGSGPPGRHNPADPSTTGAQDKVNLQDKVALIVNGTSTDSQALALALARKGMHVILLYFDEQHRSAAAIKERVEAQERRCLLISGMDLGGGAGDDIDEKRFAKQTIHRIIETFGRLDVFINLSDQPSPHNGDGAPLSHIPSLRSLLFPNLPIMKAALNQIAEPDPDG